MAPNCPERTHSRSAQTNGWMKMDKREKEGMTRERKVTD